MTDLQIVEQCLLHWRSFAQGFRYAGLMDKLKETDTALEALGRIKRPRFQWEARAVEGENNEETHAT
jgi:hypothetical protein